MFTVNVGTDSKALIEVSSQCQGIILNLDPSHLGQISMFLKSDSVRDKILFQDRASTDIIKVNSILFNDGKIPHDTDVSLYIPFALGNLALSDSSKIVLDLELDLSNITLSYDLVVVSQDAKNPIILKSYTTDNFDSSQFDFVVFDDVFADVEYFVRNKKNKLPAIYLENLASMTNSVKFLPLVKNTDYTLSDAKDIILIEA